jgi:hypothetical protein
MWQIIVAGLYGHCTEYFLFVWLVYFLFICTDLHKTRILWRLLVKNIMLVHDKGVQVHGYHTDTLLLIHYLSNNFLFYLHFIAWGQKIVFCNSNKFGCLITVNTLFKLYVMYKYNLIDFKCVNVLYYLC